MGLVFEVDNKTLARRELAKKIEKMVGYIPEGFGDILNILSHPDLIDQTREYLNLMSEE